MSIYTKYKVYCQYCGTIFETSPGGHGGYGRHRKTCSEKCHNELELIHTQSILGHSISDKRIEEKCSNCGRKPLLGTCDNPDLDCDVPTSFS